MGGRRDEEKEEGGGGPRVGVECGWSPTGSQPKGAPGPPGIGKWWPEGGNDVDTVQSGAPGIGKWGIGKWGPERGKTSLCKPHPCVYVRVSGRRRLEGPVKAHVKEQMKGLVKGRLKGQLKRRAKGRVKGVGGEIGEDLVFAHPTENPHHMVEQEKRGHLNEQA